MPEQTDRSADHADHAERSGGEIRFMVTAQVMVLDDTDTTVNAATMDRALQVIRKDARAKVASGPPLVTLADAHRNSALFSRDEWLVTETALHALAKPLGRPADYRLLYHAWQIREVGTEKWIPVKLSALLPIIDSAMETTGKSVVVTSSLLGVPEQRFEPGAVRADDAETLTSRAEHGVLDELDPDLFDVDDTDAETTMGQEEAPVTAAAHVAARAGVATTPGVPAATGSSADFEISEWIRKAPTPEAPVDVSADSAESPADDEEITVADIEARITGHQPVQDPRSVPSEEDRSPRPVEPPSTETAPGDTESGEGPVEDEATDETGDHTGETATAHAGAASRRDMRAERDERPSFLTQHRHEEPAQKGWRGVMSSMGIRMTPGADEQSERDDKSMVSQHWPGPRTIAVANPKGGAGKTPTTLSLAAVFARYGGGGVLAWDSNQTRGTLGWRSQQAAHDATILDLLPETDRLLTPGAQAADLSHYTHHHSDDRYDVLRSKPSVLADEQRLHAEDVDAVHRVAAKFFRLILIDSGNDESDPVWQRMIHHADQLVVATSAREDHAEGGALMLDTLARTSERGERLADNAVVVVSQAESTTSPMEIDRTVANFQRIAREVVSIPFDSALVAGPISHPALAPATQRAWLRAGAAVARGLSR
ncbi:MinD/ParA family ATP-binding protein [Nesterenkonia marinintestina]|uniref:MinD/ParA family ATP-binding protein n=1 Tax=Nesterenkonia marinintestina TaxID=2979865 RepID=UPI0021C131B9|nr:AAA family ATPase [Nesterenkonia sp. GX14115]